MPFFRPLPGSPYSPEGQRRVISSTMPITIYFRDAADLPNGPYVVKTGATTAEANVPYDATANLVKVCGGQVKCDGPFQPNLAPHRTRTVVR
jgi:hypothetical protein